MKYRLIIAISLCAVLAASSCQNKGTLTINTDQPASLKSENDSISWAMGCILAETAKATGITYNKQTMLQAFCATMDGKEAPLTREQLSDLQYRIEMKMYEHQSATHRSSMDDVKARENEYFAQLTKSNPNVKKSDKGFYYEVIKQGNGPKASLGSVVDFDYKGSFTNGEIFDQTYGNRSSIVHMVDESLMPGLREAFCMMNAGSTYKFYFPCEMAFGAQGSDDIPPYTTVIYEVELHSVSE